MILGLDMVGIVEKVGRHVKQFKPGQRVWSNSLGVHGRQGSFAEYVAVDENLLYPAPANVDDVSVVAVLQSGATACLGLIRVAMLKSSEIIFINGGAGNVGSAVIQMASARGARVFTATSGQEKLEWCKSLGAELVLDYRKNDLEIRVKELAPQGVDVFWDTSRHPNFDVSVGLLAPKGRIVLMAGADARPSFPVGPFYHKECILKGFSLLRATPIELKEAAEMINLCLTQNKLKCKIAHVMPLKEAAKAHALMESQQELWGKIVLKV